MCINMCTKFLIYQKYNFKESHIIYKEYYIMKCFADCPLILFTTMEFGVFLNYNLT